MLFPELLLPLEYYNIYYNAKLSTFLQRVWLQIFSEILKVAIQIFIR